MISYLRGPGGPLRRVAAEWVPFSLAVVVGGCAIAVVSPLTACLLAAAAWPLASAALRWVRQRPRLRRLYRLALLAHVIFWTAQGILATRMEPAAPPAAPAVSAWARGSAFHAGYAARAFEVPGWTPLAGWGSPPRRLRLPTLGGLGVLGRTGQAWMAEPDTAGQPRLPLFRASTPPHTLNGLGARALLLRPDAGGPALAVVRLDLVTSDRRLHAAIATRVAGLGIRPEGLLVAATHTHSGPGGYSDNPLSALFGTDHFSPVVFEAIVGAAVASIREASEAAVPARMALAVARDRDAASGRPIVARNRRAGDKDDVDDRVHALCFDALEGDRPIAVLLNYALHPHTHRRRHMAFDRDLAGGIEEALAARLVGAPPVLFVNGAQGDVATQRRPGAPAEQIRELAAAFAAAVAPSIEAARGHGSADLRVACARVDQAMATPRVVVAALGSRAGVLEAIDRPLTDVAFATTAADVLALPLNMAIWSLGMPEARVGFGWEGDAGVVLRLTDSMGNPPCAFGAWVFETGPQEARTRVALLTEPGEAVMALGRAWRDAAASRGIPHTLVLGLTNGSCAYITPARAYRRDGYEAESTMYGPTTGATATAALTTALDAALHALGL